MFCFCKVREELIHLCGELDTILQFSETAQIMASKVNYVYNFPDTIVTEPQRWKGFMVL